MKFIHQTYKFPILSNAQKAGVCSLKLTLYHHFAERSETFSLPHISHNMYRIILSYIQYICLLCVQF